MSGRIRRAHYRCDKCGANDSTLLYENEHTPTAIDCHRCHGKLSSKFTDEETHKEDLEPEEPETEESNAN